MKFTVYILFSEQFNKHYTGTTSSIEERLKSHYELGKDWTEKYRPLETYLPGVGIIVGIFLSHFIA